MHEYAIPTAATCVDHVLENKAISGDHERATSNFLMYRETTLAARHDEKFECMDSLIIPQSTFDLMLL